MNTPVFDADDCYTNDLAELVCQRTEAFVADMLKKFEGCNIRELELLMTIQIHSTVSIKVLERKYGKLT